MQVAAYEWISPDDVRGSIEIVANGNAEAVRSIPEEGVAHCLRIAREADAILAADEDALFLVHDAALVVHEVGRAFLEAHEWTSSVLLKRLIEAALSNDLEYFAYSSAKSILDELYPVLRQKLIERGIPVERWNEDSLDAVEQAFFVPSSKPDDYIIGGLLLCCLRVTFLTTDPRGLGSAVFAVREAYAFFRAGMGPDAEEALQWGTAKLDALDREKRLLPTERIMVGELYLAAAVGAVAGGVPHWRLHLLEWASHFLPPKGDERARCDYNIGDEYQQQGRLADAARMYEAALGTPKLQDDCLRGVISTSLGALRSELEGDLRKLRLDPGLVETFGGSTECGEALQQIIRREYEGERPTEEDFARAARAIWDHIGWLEERQRPDGVLSQVVLMLSLLTEIEFVSRWPVSRDAAFEKGDAYLAQGDEASRWQYEQLKSVLQPKMTLDLPDLSQANGAFADLMKGLGRKPAK